MLFGVLALDISSVFAAGSTAQAYYVGADRETKGYWYYVGENEKYGSFSFTKTNDKDWFVDRDENLRITGQTLGGYGNYWSCRDSEEVSDVPFDPSLRKYGRDGLVGVYLKLQYGMFLENGAHRLPSGDGRPCKDESLLSDFTEASQINYVEYPEWIEKDKISCKANFLEYWQHSEDLIHGGFVRDKDLLSPDPYRWNRKVGQFGVTDGRSEIFTLPVNDEDYHLISVYVNNNYTYTAASLKSNLEIYDLNDNFLCSVEDTEAAAGVYFKFIVKGAVKVKLSGESSLAVAGIFFDPIENSESYAKTDFKAELSGSKTVDLTWKSENPAATVILKKEKNDAQFSYLATVPAGMDMYTDTANKTSKEYEYLIYPATVRTAPDSAPNGYTAFEQIYTYYKNSATVKQKTADYKLSDIAFSSRFYEGFVNEEMLIEANIKRGVRFNGDKAEGGEVYAHCKVSVTLRSDDIKNTLDGKDVEFIGTDLGSVVSDENGVILFPFVPAYSGEYSLRFTTFDEDGETEETSYAGGEWDLDVYVLEEKADSDRPIAFEISQAIKPGDTVSISGYGFTDSSMLKVAYALQATGVKKRTYDEAYRDAAESIFYIDRSEILEVAADGTNLMFKLPSNAAAGVYDIWILNECGWSEPITLNNPIPVFASQEASYAGLPIEIVGRNFDPAEYGMGENFSEHVGKIRIKLTQIGDIKGRPISDPVVKVIGVKDGVKFYAKRDLQGTGVDYENKNFVWGDTAHLNYSITGEDVYWSNAYKIAFDTPDVAEGAYKIEVAIDGRTFYELQPQYVNETLQPFKIYAKKAANYDKKIYGGEQRIGNDPLGLEVYWAQDFKWHNVETIDSAFIQKDKAFSSVTSGYETEFKLADATMAEIRSKLQKLDSKGGGVLYLPAGHYFIHGGGSATGVINADGRERGQGIEIPANCAIVGAGHDQTYFELVYDNVYSSGLFSSSSNNVGIARLTMCDYRLGEADERKGYRADMFIYFRDSYSGDRDDNYAWRNQNNFLIGLDLIQVKRTPYDFNGDKFLNSKYPPVEGGRRLIKMHALKNTVVKNIFTVPSEVVVQTAHYSKLESIESHADGANWKIGEKYVICENVLNDGGKSGHGLNGRSYAYCGSNFVTRQGRIGEGEGETFLFEPADIQCQNYGDVLGASARTVTAKIVKGSILNDGSPLCSNLFTMFIIGGKGAGQWRYVSRTPVAGLDGVNTGFTYKLLDGERDWDVSLDRTSKYTIFPSMAYNTFYKNTCTNSGGALLVAYSGTVNSIAVKNTCINTGGITTESINSSSSQLPTWYIRVERNYVYGVSHGIEQGIENKLSSSYNTLDFRSGIRCRIDQSYIHGDRLLNSITFKDNEAEHVNKITAYGKEIGFSGVLYVGQSGNASIKNIIIERNNIHDTNNNGIYVGENVADCVVSDNKVYATSAEQETNIVSSNTAIRSLTTFIDGEETLVSASGEYAKGAKLPVLPDRNGMVLLGWTKNADTVAEENVILTASGLSETLYAVYGYKITFDDHFEGGNRKEYTVVQNSMFEKTVNPSYRSGYTFGGWYYDEDCNYAFDEATEIDGNLTLYAKWTAKDGGTIEPIEPPLEIVADRGVNARLIVAVCLIVAAIVEASVFVVVIVFKHRKR